MKDVGARLGREHGRLPLDEETTGQIVARKPFSRLCRSTVRFEVDGRRYETSYSRCPDEDSVVVKYDATSPDENSTAGPLGVFVVRPMLAAISLWATAGAARMVAPHVWREVRRLARNVAHGS